jgi:hypothetical protein
MKGSPDVDGEVVPEVSYMPASAALKFEPAAAAMLMLFKGDRRAERVRMGPILAVGERCADCHTHAAGLRRTEQQAARRVRQPIGRAQRASASEERDESGGNVILSSADRVRALEQLQPWQADPRPLTAHAPRRPSLPRHERLRRSQLFRTGGAAGRSDAACMLALADRIARCWVRRPRARDLRRSC